MNSAPLDPWSDAAAIAARLRQPGSFLAVVLAAESWCRKCRDFRPVFDRVTRVPDAGGIWLWLDLEDHTEFVGDFVPDDLPWLLVYRDKQLWTSEFATEAALLRAPDFSAMPQALAMQHADRADIRASLLRDDWAR